MRKFKVIVLVCVLLAATFLLSACGNQQLFDVTYSFDRARVNMWDTVVEGRVQSWKDYDDSDVVQVVIDGVTYLTYYSNVVLIAE